MSSPMNAPQSNDTEFPRLKFGIGEADGNFEHINSSCSYAFLKEIAEQLPSAYAVVKESVFRDIIGVYENRLGYSGQLIHSMMRRQLVTKANHEFWCVFGDRPLRFSLQEFHAVTGLKCHGDYGTSIGQDWEDDGGFWSNVLKDDTKITLQDVKKKYLSKAKEWSVEDKIRFVYLF